MYKEPARQPGARARAARLQEGRYSKIITTIDVID